MQRTNFRNGTKGFFEIKRKRALPEADARHALARHKTYLRNVDPLNLLLLPISKKEQAIIKFLYGNSHAKMSDLFTLTDPDSHFDNDTLRRTINRLNTKLLDYNIHLEIVWENGNSSRPGKDRVWLDVCF